jgi:sialic acid synthase SpsE
MKNSNKLEIIAEIGVNHNGKLQLAKKLITTAKTCGADAVKFQTFITKNFVTKKTKKVKYQISSSQNNESHYEMLKKLELKKKDFVVLKNFCVKKKIKFISTPYDLESVEILKSLNTKIYKTASADISDYLLHKRLSKLDKKVIISTGMSTISEIKKTVKIYKKKNIILMHCVSCYPCDVKDINISRIKQLQKVFKLPIGFSDHTNEFEPAIMAYAMGVRIFEKHFTLSNNMPGPDHKSSFDPKKFKKYVMKLKLAEKIYGRFINKALKVEVSMKKTSSKSIMFNKNMKKYETIKINNLIMKRPGTGLDGFYIPKILGKKLKNNIKSEVPLKLNDIL